MRMLQDMMMKSPHLATDTEKAVKWMPVEICTQEINKMRVVKTISIYSCVQIYPDDILDIITTRYRCGCRMKM